MRFPLRRTRRSVGKGREAVGESRPRGGDSPRKLKRRWLQFSLRSLLLFMVVWALFWGAWKTYVDEHYRQKQAIKTIVRLGGSTRDLKEEADGPRWVRWIIGDEYFYNVTCVELGPTVDDAKLAEMTDALARLPRLDHIKTDGCRITDRGLAHLKPLSNIRCLHLRGTRIRGDALQHFSESKHLVSLMLECSPVTDSALRHVGKIQQLQNLSLYRTQVTDKGLAHLENLTNLRGKRGKRGQNYLLPFCLLSWSSTGADG